MELKELKGYLGYGVLVYDEKQESKTDRIIGVFRDHLDFENWSPINTQIHNYKIVLHPLSDLTNPCLEGGKIPIVELANLEFKDCDCDECPVNIISEDEFELRCAHIESWCDLVFHKKINSFSKWIDGEGICPCENYLDIIEKLYEWHFDIHGLIERGEAIDINTIKQ